MIRHTSTGDDADSRCRSGRPTRGHPPEQVRRQGDVESDTGVAADLPPAGGHFKLKVLALSIVGAGAIMLAAEPQIFPLSVNQTPAVQIAGASMGFVGSLAIAAGGLIFLQLLGLMRTTSDEETARARLRQAEQQLAELLQRGQAVEAPSFTGETRQATQTRLTLPALWEVTHSRLDLYHQIATGQARRSFITAQAAIGAGFLLLITFAVLATQTHTTAGAITTAALGAVSAALAGYISRTFVRSQESAAAHLRAYFDQPLEFSKYLAAERLLASNSELDGDKRAAILTALVQAIVASNPP